MLASIVPTLIYVTVLWWLDRYEQEPRLLLFSAFVWGAIPAAALSIFAESILGAPLQSSDALVSGLAMSSVLAPLVEECAKGLAVLLISILFRHEFDDLLDGVIYGASIGFGFAMTENSLYFLRSYRAGGMQQLSVLILMRSIVFGLNHALFTSAYGASLGYSRTVTSGVRRRVLAVAGLGIAVMLHAAHNLFASLTHVSCFSLLLSFMVDWSGITVMLVVLLLAWQKERNWIAVHLATEVDSGLLTVEEYRMIGSYRRRLAAQWRALVKQGWSEARRLSNLAQYSTELAFKLQQGDLVAAGALRERIVSLTQRS